MIQELPSGTSRFAARDLACSSWRNGGGSTREIASGHFADRVLERDPPWDWRLSLAAIASDGPFSAFPDVERMAVLVQGRLRLATRTCTMRFEAPGDLRSFPGDAEIFATLDGGEAALLNLMFRRGRVAADVKAWRGNGMAEALPRGSVFLFVAAGEFDVALQSEDGGRIVRCELHLHEGLRIDGAGTRMEFGAAGDGACLVELRVNPMLPHSKDVR